MTSYERRARLLTPIIVLTGLFTIALMLSAPGLLAGTEVAIRDLEAEDLQHVSFSLAKSTEVEIDAVGACVEHGDQLFAYAWIIDAASRELVWSMDEEVTDNVSGSKWLRQYNDAITLPAGAFELYYFAGKPYYTYGDFTPGELKDLLDGLGDIFKKGGSTRIDDEELERKLAPRYYVQISSEDEIRTLPEATTRPAKVSILHPGNDTYQKVTFTVTDDLNVDIYCIGEFAESAESMVDGGWIVDAHTRTRVWDMDRSNTQLAGGADKNRKFDRVVSLKKGDYIAYYVTDDSHTYDDWNAPPPVDPEAWGLQISTSRAADADKLVVREFETTDMPLLRMTGMGDNELVSESFRLTKPTSLRIYAVGEYDEYDDAMADYAWLARAGDRQKIWAMSGANTDPAGGARKNRQFDGTLELDNGDYTIYYVSDGSHSAGDGWNSSPPYDQKAYGVSLYPGSEDYDRSQFTLIDRADIKSPGLLVAITEVGDDAEQSHRFTLTSPTRVRIHAVGEGTHGEMTDYGWIEDARSGDIVWEMTYRKTRHAGGAEKNRMVDQVILLDKGEYIVYYVTDDSHAFPDWNAGAPTDPMDWGISVSEADKTGP